MGRGARWIDLLDPTRDELLADSPVELRPQVLERLLAAADEAGREARPTLESHGPYVLGVLLVAVAVPEEDRVFYQEIDLVLTSEVALTVRKTPPGAEAFDLAEVQRSCDAHGSPSTGVIAYYLVDEIAERYLQLIDVLDDEIDELEDGIQGWPNDRVRMRLSELRHDVLGIRRTLSPTRDAVRRVVDGRVDVEGAEIFDRELELDFADAYDKLLRATEALDISRELITSAREFHQSKIGQEQNEIVKKLTVIASLLLLPTLIVGVYGQNFRHFPELHWRYGYAYSWMLIVATTILQLVFFRWRKWI
jgi:magnesium transporter